MKIEAIAELANSKLSKTPPLMPELQQENLAHFREMGFRETVLDSYKFTNLNTFFEELTLNGSKIDGEIPVTKSALPTIKLLNGELVSTENLPAGLKVGVIREKLQELPALLKKDNTLSSLHHGLFGAGLFIEVEKNQVIKEPIRIHNTVNKSDIHSVTFLIKASPLSRVTILEENHSLNLPHAQITETYIEAQEGAKVEHIILATHGEDSINHASLYAQVAKDAEVRSFVFHHAGKLNRFNLTLDLNAPGANGETYALYLTQGKEHSDVNTVINHRAPDTTSNQIAKGILDQESKGIFTGKIHILPKSQRVASGQLNKNLLLSKKAQAHSQPQLEIFADDVKCSHGSTTGQLSPEEIFYFQARGIPEDKARNLLAFGFGLEVVEKIEAKDARQYVSQIVKETLTQKFSLGGAK